VYFGAKIIQLFISFLEQALNENLQAGQFISHKNNKLP